MRSRVNLGDPTALALGPVVQRAYILMLISLALECINQLTPCLCARSLTDATTSIPLQCLVLPFHPGPSR